MVSEKEIRAVVSRVVDQMSAQGSAPAADSAGGNPKPVAGEESVALGADHGGWELKQQLVAHLRDQGFAVSDCGTHGPESVDYPDFAHEVARQVATGGCRWGVIVDGAGIGSAIVANKVPGVRAALCYDLSSARNSREHNHANVLTLGAGLIGSNLARQIVDTWLATPWGGGRHGRRVEKIDEIERRYARPASEGAR
jgi:ribose 5-phosphate isomerase B